MGRPSFTTMQKCACVIRQLVYGIPPDAMDEYLEMKLCETRFIFSLKVYLYVLFGYIFILFKGLPDNIYT